MVIQIQIWQPCGAGKGYRARARRSREIWVCGGGCRARVYRDHWGVEASCVDGWGDIRVGCGDRRLAGMGGWQLQGHRARMAVLRARRGQAGPCGASRGHDGGLRCDREDCGEAKRVDVSATTATRGVTICSPSPAWGRRAGLGRRRRLRRGTRVAARLQVPVREIVVSHATAREGGAGRRTGNGAGALPCRCFVMRSAELS